MRTLLLLIVFLSLSANMWLFVELLGDVHSPTVAFLENTFAFFERYRDDINALATVVVAAFTMVLGIFTISLAKSTRTAASAARRSIEDLERPWLFVSSISIRLRHPHPPTGGPVFNNWFAKVAFVNVGRMPAIVDECNFGIVEKAKLPQKPVFGSHSELSIRSSLPVGEIGETNEVGPGVHENVQLIFYGRIRYRELNGKNHETGFAVEVWNVMPAHVDYPSSHYNYYT